MSARAWLMLGFALLLGGAPVWADEIGAFFTRVNTYIYADAPEQGKRYLIRRRQGYTVTDVTTDGQDRIWLQVIYEKATRTFSGEGWTPLAPHDLIGRGPEMVEVYSTILENPNLPIESIAVPSADLKLLNVTQQSRRFPQITWQKVSYTTKKSLRAWARAGAGIYRPGKSEGFITRAYADMVSRALNKEKMDRLLAGVVRVGDTTLEVSWALGKPLRVVEEDIADAKRTIWHYPTVVVQFENQVVGQIN